MNGINKVKPFNETLNNLSLIAVNNNQTDTVLAAVHHLYLRSSLCDHQSRLQTDEVIMGKQITLNCIDCYDYKR